MPLAPTLVLLQPPHAHTRAHALSGAGTLCPVSLQWRPRSPAETQPKTAAQQRVGYTLWNLSLLLLAVLLALLARAELLHGEARLLDEAVVRHLLCVALCSSVGVCVSFHVGMLLGQREGVLRLQLHNGLPQGATFWLYNALAHIVPVLLLHRLVVARGDAVLPLHGLWSAVLHLGWGLLETSGTLLLDAVYTELWPWQWHLTWAFALASEIFAAPALL